MTTQYPLCLSILISSHVLATTFHITVVTAIDSEQSIAEKVSPGYKRKLSARFTEQSTWRYLNRTQVSAPLALTQSYNASISILRSQSLNN